MTTRYKSHIITIRNKQGQNIGEIEAWPTGIPGLFVHQMIDDGDKWTCTHCSGFRFGGRFSSKEDAQETVYEILKGSMRKVDFTVAPNKLHENPDAIMWSQLFFEELAKRSKA
jgi:hypothetical protein